MGTFLKCPSCNRIQTKGQYCVFDGVQLQHANIVEYISDTEERFSFNFSKKIKIDNAGSKDLELKRACVKDCVNNMLEQVELNIINESFRAYQGQREFNDAAKKTQANSLPRQTNR